MKHTTLTALALGTAVALLGGCKTPPKATESKQESSPQKEEYATVYPVGSWIPRKVKKKGDILGEKTQVTDATALERANEQGRTHTVKESQLSGR